MTTAFPPLPISATDLKELRVRDDAGNPPRPYPDDEGGAPLRCCLRSSAAGTGADPGAYDEQGPVFVHAEDCGGPADEHPGYPWARPGALRVLRRYDGRGHITGGRLLELPDDAQAAFAHALAEAFADPETAQVHVRAVEYGCYHFRVDRP
jgi:Protein of unknown function (DUF1203)